MRTDFQLLRQQNLAKKRWYCAQCDLAFATRNELFTHNRQCPSKVAAKNYFEKNHQLQEVVCQYCGKTLRGQTALTTHQKYYCVKSDVYDAEASYKLKQKRISFNRKIWSLEDRRKKQSERTVFNHFWEYRTKNPIVYESKNAGIVKLDSSWELEVAKRLDSLNVEWYRPRVRLPYIDVDGKEHGYFPDFYVKTYHCFIEVKSNFIAKNQNSNGKISYLKQHYPFIVWLETEDSCRTFTLQDCQCGLVPEKDKQNIDFWLEKVETLKEKKLKESLKKREKQNQILAAKKEKLKKDFELLKNSSIDFSKRGWVQQASKLLHMKKAGNYVRKNFPELHAVLRKGLNSNAGKHWWTNGTDEVSAANCPDGWYAGRKASESFLENNN